MAKYSFEFKLHVVELYLTTEASYQELVLKNLLVFFAIAF